MTLIEITEADAKMLGLHWPDLPYTDPGDGRPQCDVCGKFQWPAIHSCKGVRVAPVDPNAVQFPDWKPTKRKGKR